MKTILLIATFLLLVFQTGYGQKNVENLGVQDLFDDSRAVLTVSTDSVKLDSIYVTSGARMWLIGTTTSQDSLISVPVRTLGSGEIEIEARVHSRSGTLAADLDYGIFVGKGLLSADANGYRWTNIKSFTATDSTAQFTYLSDAADANEMFSGFKVKFAETAGSQANRLILFVRINRR